MTLAAPYAHVLSFGLAVLAAPPSDPVSALDTASLVQQLSEHSTLDLDFGRAGRIQAEVEILRPTTSGGFVWSGRLTGEGEGTISFAASSTDPSTATIQAVLRRGTRVFQLQPDATGEPAIRLIDTASLPACGNGPEHRIGRGSVDQTEHNSAPPGPSLPGQRPVIDLLVLYTPAAKVGEGGVMAIETLIELAAVETNLANLNSGLDHRVRIVHTAETLYVESGNHFTDLNNLQTPGDGNMDEAGAMRDAYRADCVMLITDTMANCGNGYLWFDPPNPAFSDFAFSVVSRHCAVSNLSFAHELGHNFGCDHDHGNSTGGAYAYSHGHRTASGLYRTVMALPPGTRVPQFSDPNASEGGEPLGVAPGSANAAYNVQSLGLVVPLVADFRKAIPHAVGAGMTTSAGQTFTLDYSGSNQILQGDFKLQATGGVPGSMAVAFFGHEPNVAPFLGGTLYAQAPLQRFPLQSLDATGAAAWTIFPGANFVAGQETFFQVYGFDPANGTGLGVAMTNGLRVEFR